MKFIDTNIKEVKIIEPAILGDDRGYFLESFSQKLFSKNIKASHFVQDNESKSSYGVLRGLHYQLAPFAQAKLVRVVKGKVLDIVVDLRKGSPTFGQYVSVELSEGNKWQLFVPRGFAHGFVVLSDDAIFSYKVDNYYSKESERGIAFDDKTLNIDWKLDRKNILLSEKDTQNPSFLQADLFDYSDNLYEK